MISDILRRVSKEMHDEYTRGSRGTAVNMIDLCRAFERIAELQDEAIPLGERFEKREEVQEPETTPAPEMNPEEYNPKVHNAKDYILKKGINLKIRVNQGVAYVGREGGTSPLNFNEMTLGEAVKAVFGMFSPDQDVKDIINDMIVDAWPTIDPELVDEYTFRELYDLQKGADHQPPTEKDEKTSAIIPTPIPDGYLVFEDGGVVRCKYQFPCPNTSTYTNTQNIRHLTIAQAFLLLHDWLKPSLVVNENQLMEFLVENWPIVDCCEDYANQTYHFLKGQE